MAESKYVQDFLSCKVFVEVPLLIHGEMKERTKDHIHETVFGSNWSLVQWSPTECGVYECDQDFSTMRRPWSTTAFEPW